METGQKHQNRRSSLPLMIIRVPDACSERLADSDADTDGDTDDKEADQDLNDDAVSLAEVGEAVAVAALVLGRLRLPSPVVLSGPDLALGPSSGALG